MPVNPLSLVQTDLASDLSLSADCSGTAYPGVAVTSGVFNYQISENGTAGAAAYDIIIDAGAISVTTITLISPQFNTGNTLWDVDGTNTIVPIEFTVTDADATVDSVSLCRIDSTGTVLASIASATFGTSPSVGVNNYDLGLPVATDFNTTDRLMVSVVMSDTGLTAPTIQIVLSQTIQTGIGVTYTVSGAAIASGVANINGADLNNIIFFDKFTNGNGSYLGNTIPDTIGTGWTDLVFSGSVIVNNGVGNIYPIELE